MSLSSGDVFGRYTIETLLGEGGMGRVYRAHDARLDRKVALKILLADEGPHVGDATTKARTSAPPTSEGPARLLREARAAAALDHPNAVAIFDVGEVDGTPYIAMEFIDGQTLRASVGDPGVPMHTRQRWLVEIARALSAAHACGLVHRDIKPENVMVRADGAVKVLDFGIARRVRLDIDPTGATEAVPMATLTAKGVIVGTPLYMAPEQVRGETLDARVDQYAWGVLAYELLSGHAPFGGAAGAHRDAIQLIAEILTKEPAPLDDAFPPIATAVQRVVLRALAKSKEKRFASMEKIIARLEPHASDSTRSLPPFPSDPPPDAPPRVDAASAPTKAMTDVTPPPRSRVRGRVLVAVAVVAALGAVVPIVLMKRAVPKDFAKPDAPEGSQSVSASQAATPTVPTPTTNAEALAAYKAGLQASRDASLEGARRSFESAIRLDPTFAPALLRHSIVAFDASPTEARQSFQRAAQLRNALDEHDQVLLDATEPYVQRQPSDFVEWERRLARAVERFGDDADLWYLLGNARAHRGGLRSAIDAYSRATLADPKFARALWATGETQAYLGDFDAALASLGRCLDGSPGATNCMNVEAWIYEDQQRCDAVEAIARRWIATETDSPTAYHLLANALLARGRPIETIEETLAQKWARTPERTRVATELVDRIHLDLLVGRFEDAERRALELARAVASEPTQDAHAKPALLLVQIRHEMGRDADAAKLADEYMKRKDAWVADPREEDFALAKDVMPEMLAALARVGRITPKELAARRAEWLGEWERGLASAFRSYLWLHGYAKPAETADDAKAALAALPSFEPLPRFRPMTYADGDIGKVYLLAGDAARAVPSLERAARSCVALDFPIAHMHAYEALGRAREATGDSGGACAAYAVVIERWGRARARTTDRARGRRRALGCPGGTGDSPGR
jgi:serine/threonine protein kinase